MRRELRFRPLRTVSVLAAALLGTACTASSPGLVYATGPGSVTGDGLQRVRWSQLGAEFVKPGAELAGYDKVLIDPLTISAAPTEDKRRMVPVRRYYPTPGFLAGMRRTYREMFAKQFTRGGFSVVREPGPGVLRISGHVVDLVLTARLDPEEQAGNSEFVTSFGDLTLLIDVRDSVRDEPLLRTLDRQPISRYPLLTRAERNSTGANLSAQRDVFGHQALLLQQEIIGLQRLGTLPAPPAGVAAPPPEPAPAPGVQ